jgi:hypothetical protein
MKSLRFIDRQAGYGLSAIGLLVAMVAPGLVPAFASADVVTDRSIQLSSAATSAQNVTYNVTFTPATAGATQILIDFCNNSPVIGDACTPPTGFDASSADVSSASTTAGYSVATKSANSVVVDNSSALAASTSASFELTGIDNPTAAGSLYARIVTYANGDTVGTSANPDATSTHLDDGGIAMDIEDAIGVSGRVQEALTFCASKNAITSDCSALTAADAPNIVLGNDGVLSSTVSSAPIYTDISTNAASGAVVRLKSDATGCGGLLRAGAPTACDIVAGTGSDAAHTVADNTAAFGVKLGALTVTGVNGAGLVEAADYNNNNSPANFYDALNYKMNFVDANSGVTSAYGDAILDTNGAPVSQGKATLNFGAAVNDTTPAGHYSANISLIATGKF